MSMFPRRETVNTLIKILNTTQSPPGEKRMMGLGKRADYNEVYPNLFLSDAETAKNKEFLKEIGITHVLNAAEGSIGFKVNTNAEYYQDVGIKYLGFELDDFSETPISHYFQQAADFIDQGISSGGKVLVNCYCGISRSSTCTLAYLMIKRKMSLEDALRHIKTRRWIWPNDGFLSQLDELECQLQSSI